MHLLLLFIPASATELQFCRSKSLKFQLSFPFHLSLLVSLSSSPLQLPLVLWLFMTVGLWLQKTVSDDIVCGGRRRC
ncbi:hypothetical protein OIU77_031283 [Salix suchowensis]|uniref:Uncharacterized protein n=1 Tax=Salix suchowensis TaxID=1278906 RepID=A0ABQ9BH41_9ROSI|nr:hypothetical protein OIU77_031283 [Salix suchowensis]